ncbi:MAG: pyruvate:ferredoxin (flavodoxin) oxidoreductase [Firmicutes bacterium]|nr:pyruvate:ferredoxin (flavodoxin) oxidoreductase [Bacillota bacterium]
MSKKMTIDGNYAASYVAYAFSEVAAIYPITPSSNMAEYADEWASKGEKNMFGQVVKIAEMQSEAGAAGAVHGSLAAGSLTTTYTASQGLLLMIPNMYKISGELWPTVFHVSARAIAAQALNIFGDHQDVMACRQTGFAMVASNSVQEAMDLAAISHLATLKSRVPFLHFFDGFRTSHEVSKIDAPSYEELKSLVDIADVDDFRARALNPEHPTQKGTAQNPDVYFQNREACNKYYDATPAIVQKYMNKYAKLTGRQYNLFDYVGAKDAEKIVILMGSGADAVEETVNYLNAKGEKTGVLKVRLYRPFAVDAFVKAIPATAKFITVLDRTKEPGSLGEPLFLDVVAALSGKTTASIIGGRYGLGLKEFTPSMIKSVFDNMGGLNKAGFTVGIVDDVTGTSLEIKDFINAAPEGTVRCKFYGLGSDGTVGANKNSIKIIGDHTDKYAQGYFVYDSKKSGGFTVSHLRFGDKPIKSSYLIDQADFVACHVPSYLFRYPILSSLKEGGTFLLNSLWSPEEMTKQLPAKVKNEIAKKNIKFYTINANKIAAELGLGGRINSVMQASFFFLNPDIMPYAEAEGYMKDAILKSYGHKGEKIVNANNASIDRATSELLEVAIPADWATTTKGATMFTHATKDKFFKKVASPILLQEGDKLPVSCFTPCGTVPSGTTKFEKRSVAVNAPVWINENCIQCNQCSYVCPHSTIVPVLATEEQLAGAPASFDTKDATGFKGYKYRIAISPLDCMGCGVCANVCPSKKKALEMKPIAESIEKESANWDFAYALPETDAPIKDIFTVKNSQFKKSLFEFSGACSGCGETPYIKLICQLYGDRMVIGNATGCSSIYGGTYPSNPYTTNDKGQGPAWANSLFEDTAEFSFGMALAFNQRRAMLEEWITELKAEASCKNCVKACEAWLKSKEDAEGSKKASTALLEALSECNCDGKAQTLKAEIIKNKDCLVKKSVWAFGGDGWAYDIGFGGLDHVIASGENVNLLVMDTEVYSNTGGQASKATPTASIAKFAYSGKRTRKKDLGLIAMGYGYVYVAQIAIGADMNQAIKAIKEAEAYDGPSLIICYSTCINHGVNMSQSMAEMKKAVDCGYWHLYRYNPTLADEGKNPFILDSKEPTASYQEFLANETRYNSLKKQDAELAQKLFDDNEKEAKLRYANYLMLANKNI